MSDCDVSVPIFVLDPPPDGMPESFSFDLFSAICQALSEGVPIKVITRALGVEEELVEWKQKQPKYINTQIGRASRLFIIDRINLIKVAGEKKWNASSWLLERFDPEVFDTKYAKMQRVQSSDNKQITIQILSAVPRPDGKTIEVVDYTINEKQGKIDKMLEAEHNEEKDGGTE